ncbi:MAG: hypothetical protein OEQ28_02005 [Acidobacteriota bacterium]|nr:hypothetical protein [Acidobacteriota bacterium]
MMYDFPESLLKTQPNYKESLEPRDLFLDFPAAPGLRDMNNKPRPGWNVFEERGKKLEEASQEK